MALIDDVQTVCRRLAPHGWADLLARHDLDITAPNLAEELARELTAIRRNLPGFDIARPTLSLPLNRLCGEGL